jgi:hypothetical protein
MFAHYRFIYLIIPLILQYSCKEQHTEVQIDPIFNALFHLDSGGVTGTNGTISIPLEDESSVFVMGDFFLGEVINGQRDSTPDIVLGNVLIELDQDQKSHKIRCISRASSESQP